MFSYSFEKHEWEGGMFIIFVRNVTSEGFFIAPENFSERGQKVNNSYEKDEEGLCVS